MTPNELSGVDQETIITVIYFDFRFLLHFLNNFYAIPIRNTKPFFGQNLPKINSITMIILDNI